MTNYQSSLNEILLGKSGLVLAQVCLEEYLQVRLISMALLLSICKNANTFLLRVELILAV
jgi:hypothetical protein